VAEAAETQRKSGEETDEERGEAKREAEEEAKNTKRVGEAADDALMDAKEDTELANSEADRMKSNSTEEKDAVPQTPAVQLCEGGAPELESGGTNGSLNLDSAFKEPLLQNEPLTKGAVINSTSSEKDLVKQHVPHLKETIKAEDDDEAENKDLDLEFLKSFQFETEDDRDENEIAEENIKNLPVCHSDDEKKRWSTYVNYEHDKEKQVEDTEEENEEEEYKEEEEVMEKKEAVEIEVEETEEVLKGNKEESNGSCRQDQDFVKSFQFETEDETKGSAGANEAGKTNSSLSNADIGEEETEERVEESGQEYNKLERLEDALAQNYRPFITSGTRDASASKNEDEVVGGKHESQEEAIGEEAGEESEIKEQGEIKEVGENEEEGEIKKKGEIKEEGEINEQGEIKEEDEIKKKGEIKDEGEINEQDENVEECEGEENWESEEEDVVNESELEEVFCQEDSDEEVLKENCDERNDIEKSKSSAEESTKSETPLGDTDDEGETDKEAYSTDEGIVATDDDAKEEVDQKGERPKSKNVSKIPRIIVTDEERREEVEKEAEHQSKSKNITRIPRRHHL